MEYLEIPWRPEETDAEPDRAAADPPAAAMAQLTRIRELMEGSATCRVLSGGSAIVSGVIATAACAFSAAILAAAPDAPVLRMAPLDAVSFRAIAAVWSAAFISAAAVELLLTKREARRLGTDAFDFPSGSPMLRRMRLAYTAPLVTGALLTVSLARAGVAGAIPAAWLSSYGAALLCAGLFSTRAVRALGAAFLALGAGATVAPEANLVWLFVGFGLAHAVYGVLALRGRS